MNERLAASIMLCVVLLQMSCNGGEVLAGNDPQGEAGRLT